MENNKEKKSQIEIKIDDEIAKGQYSNLIRVIHSQAEFIVDFINLSPGVKETKVRSRIVVSPVHIKTFLNALNDNVAKYEKKFGEIKVHSAIPKFNQDTLPN
tara:strand:+ start:1156 stop:1461 length:306 start_codon:yes stop_codon:yes gene_type:complete